MTFPRADRTPWLSYGGLTLLLAGFGGLVLLKALPYSSSHLTAVPAEETRRAPSPNFTLGPLVWDVSELQSGATLGAFRKAFRESCDGSTGLAAATCVAVALARRFPNGEPTDEFFQTPFDPVDHLRRHLAGEPGHCVTRSSIMASQLLAVGIPARVVQLLPARGKGHTLVEVWDPERRWLLVDPTWGGVVGSRSGPQSAADLQSRPESITWYGIPSTAFPKGQGIPEAFMRDAFKGHLIYPDPWLYLRQGHGATHWPWRGRFVHVGPNDWLLGPAQMSLQVAVPAAGLAGSVLLLVGLVGWLGSMRRSSGLPGRDYLPFARDLDGIPPA